MNKCQQLVLAMAMSLTAAASQAADAVKTVTVAQVEVAKSALQQRLFCLVNTPFIYQASSHSESELIERLAAGSRVRKGQVLARQDGFYLRQSLASLELKIQISQAELEFSRTEYRRLQVLQTDKLISQSRLAEDKLKAARFALELQELQQQRRSLQRRIQRLQHIAPYDGQILSVSAQPGEQLTTGQEILQLLPSQHRQLVCKLPLTVYQSLNSVETMGFSLNGKPIKLHQISQNLDSETQNLSLYFNYPNNSDIPLLVGQRLSIEMQLPSLELSQVPYDAVYMESNSYQLWRVDKNKRVSKINPKVVATVPGYFLVQSPLRPGDMVVVRGQRGLVEQQQIGFKAEAVSSVTLAGANRDES